MNIERYDQWPNLVAMFFEQAGARGDAPFLWGKDGTEDFQATSWRAAADAVSSLARMLRANGIEPGDRVMLVSENRPEWVIADLAIMAAGAISVPAYVTNTVDDHLHILTNSGAKAAIVSTKRLAEKLLPAVHTAPDVDFVIAMEPPRVKQDIGAPIHLWRQALEDGAALDGDIAGQSADIARGSTACLIYTSGTGGVPKGVMLSHGAIMCNCLGAFDALEELGLGEEVFLSFLPLSHSYEHSAGLFFPISIGAQIYFAEGVEALGRNMAETRPTIMTAVPRLYESLHARISRDVEKAGGLKKTLFAKAVELGRKRHAGQPRGLGGVLLDPLLDRLVRAKVRARFGGRLKALVSGGAPLNPEVGTFFQALGLCILQGYGQTESAPVVSVNRPKRIKMHTVGPPLKRVEVRIAADGEILVRGELVMQGYWRNQDATNETIRDGWLHTGDVGVFDEDGYIQITDRKKDIIVLSGGDNVSPARVEGFITLEPEILQAMVYGDKRPYLVALVVPDPDFAAAWAERNGADPAPDALAANEEYRKAVYAAIERVNRHVANIEKVRRFVFADEPFSIDNEEMTPTLKIRRHKIRARYLDRLEALYEAKSK